MDKSGKNPAQAAEETRREEAGKKALSPEQEVPQDRSLTDQEAEAAAGGGLFSKPWKSGTRHA